MTYLEDVQAALRQWDADRPRSRQEALGWSDAMGCRAAIGYTLAAEWALDDPDTWRAICGTLLHDGLTDVLAKATSPDGFGLDVAYGGILGHPDHVQVEQAALREWKFPTLAVAQSWQRDADAFLPKRAQAHGYAAGLIDAGLLPEACTVTVLAMPVDGTFADWWEHTEPFDRAVADAAVARVTEVRALMAAGEPLPRDKPTTWCERFCDFFTACRGDFVPGADEPITDAETAAMVDRYADLTETIRPLDAEKKRLAREIRGHRGVTPGGVRISMTEPSGWKQVEDLDAVRADYAASGRGVPTKEVPTSSPSIQVRRRKS